MINAATAYQETAVITQSKGRLIVMLYDAAINFLKRAVSSIEGGDIEGRNESVQRARDIIFELNSVLDLDAGGQIAQSLRSLYNFIWRHVGQANIDNDDLMIKKMILILDDLRQSWRAIA